MVGGGGLKCTKTVHTPHGMVNETIPGGDLKTDQRKNDGTQI